MTNRIIIIALSSIIFILGEIRSQCGASANPTGSPVGGGAAYTEKILASQADIIVSSKKELITALENASSGDIIYVADEAEINLSGTIDLPVKQGVTLASGRGNNGSEGALLFVEGIRQQGSGANPLFEIKGDSARITGLRIKGPDPFVGVSPYGLPTPRGIECANYDYLEVDNCELWGWSHAAIYIGNSNFAHIHHNYIHHCLRNGLGYGVVHSGFSQTLIEANLFNANRHSIAGTGQNGQNYEARYNIVGSCATSHLFDVHGGQDYSPPDLDCYAGNRIVIQHNTFYASCYRAVVIRGYPREEAIISQNLISHNNPSWAFQQKPAGSCRDQPLNFDSFENCHDVSLDSDCIPDILDLKEGFCSYGNWTETRKGEGKCYAGDFDGDGKDDMGRYINTESPDDGFQVLLSIGSSFDAPVKWTDAGNGEEEWYVGDYDGDGKDDIARYIENGNAGDGFQVLISTGSSFVTPDRWTTSEKGPGGWYIGDYNGDGKDDIGRYIDNGTNDDGFQVLLSTGNSFAVPKKWSDADTGDQNWYVGDFNGDGKHDIFRYQDRKSSADMFLSNGSSFQPSGSWCNVENDDEYECLGLTSSGKWFVGDYDGDGADDIFRYMSGNPATEVFLSNRINEFVFHGTWSQTDFEVGCTIGDFNGDGYHDISSYDDNQGISVFLSCNEEIMTATSPQPEISTNKIKVYPNPFGHQIHFKIHSEIGDNIDIQIFDVNGRLIDQVFKGKSDSEMMTIPWETQINLRTGIYFAKIIFDNRVSVLKLIHQTD